MEIKNFAKNVVLLLVALSSLNANAASFFSGRTLYTVISEIDKTVELTTCNEVLETNYVIPRIIQGYAVTKIGQSAFQNCLYLTSVLVPEGVEVIEHFAFNNLTSLKNINLPNSLICVSSTAFDGTAWLDAKPNGVVYAGLSAYKYKGAMPAGTIIEIEEGTKSISPYAFSNQKNLLRVTLPSSVTLIYRGAFSGCNAMTSFKMGDGVERIVFNAFEKCSGLRSIVIPNSVQIIQDEAFRDCSNISEISVGTGVKSIGRSAFFNCSNLSKVTISDLESWCKIEFDLEANPLTKAGHLYLNDKLVTNLTLPESITRVGDFIFDGCKDLVSITIPKNVSYIGRYAFYRNSQLKEINAYPEIAPSTEGNAFYYTNYTNATLNVCNGSKSDYSTFGEWAKFNNIVETLNSSISLAQENLFKVSVDKNTITIDTIEEKCKVEIYNTNGLCIYIGEDKIIDNIPNGLYIVNVNGSIAKVLVHE